VPKNSNLGTKNKLQKFHNIKNVTKTKTILTPAATQDAFSPPSSNSNVVRLRTRQTGQIKPLQVNFCH
jgi:hypothetical protein